MLGEFASFTGMMGEDIRFDVQISECDPEKQHTCIRCTLMDGERELYACDVTPGARQGRLTEAVSVTFPAECYRDAMQERIMRLTVALTLEDGTRNHYPIWLIPPIDIRITREGIEKDGRMVAFVSAEEKADGAAIVVPSAEGQLPAEYCTVSGLPDVPFNQREHGQACAGRDDGAVHRHRVAAAEAVRAGGLHHPRVVRYPANGACAAPSGGHSPGGADD